VALALAPQASLGQTTTPQTASPKDRLLVQAEEMIFNKDKNTVEARGKVQIYYQGRALQADKVIYDRERNRVQAQGNAKLTEKDGTVSYADRFELTDDFKEGFVDSIRSDTSENTHMTGARAERSQGNVMALERATYTACPACAEDPDKPPMWQVRARKIIHNKDEQTIYYEDATLEFLGVPVAYVPYLSMADPSVKRKSGVLAPRYSATSKLGAGVGVPVFWAIAPNYDLTVTPNFYSRQGLLLNAEWRHQVLNGAYNVRVAGIFQKDTSAFELPPNGAGDRKFRGSVESAGQFMLNDKWRFGWDGTFLTDRWFLTDYQLPLTALSSNYFREATSTIYLTGQGERGFFDLRSYYFQGLSSYDLQSQQPIVAPVWDYNKTIDLPAAKSAGIGGEIEIDANFTHFTRELASFQSTNAATGTRTLDSAYSLYDVCTPNAQGLYTSANCLVRGIGGDYARATASVTWKRQYVDPIGQVWTPFVFARMNGVFLTLNQSNSATFTSPSGSSTIQNASQTNFFGGDANSFFGQIMPGAGVDYRYPFVLANDWATHVFEPIAQIIVRPNESTSSSLVNEDSQSLVFDDTNMFMWNKFSGYDRLEGGTRLNYGGQYTMTFRNGGYANLMVGQSFQLAGRNSYGTPDIANIGLSSGLDTKRSDVVSRFAIAPNSVFSFIAKGRFDPDNATLRRFDMTGSASLGSLNASLQYARYEAQPLIGYYKRREGVSAALKYKIDQHYFVSSNVIFDLSRHLYNDVPGIGGHAGLLSVAGMGLGLGYMDDCTTFSVNYASVYSQKSGVGAVRNQTILVQLQLRTLGDTRYQSNIGDIKVQDGLGGLSGH
jgi:LPS-assembly protein